MFSDQFDPRRRDAPPLGRDEADASAGVRVGATVCGAPRAGRGLWSGLVGRGSFMPASTLLRSVLHPNSVHKVRLADGIEEGGIAWRKAYHTLEEAALIVITWQNTRRGGKADGGGCATSDAGNADLTQQAEIVEQRPVLDQLGVTDHEQVEDRNVDRSPGRGDAHQLAIMGTCYAKAN